MRTKPLNMFNAYHIAGRMDITTTDSIKVYFKGAESFEGTLAELKVEAKERGLNLPLRAFKGTDRHGVYPCIVANTQEQAQHMGNFWGVELEPGDGRSFGSRNHAIATFKAMKEKGIPVDGDCIHWGITIAAHQDSRPHAVEPGMVREDVRKVLQAELSLVTLPVRKPVQSKAACDDAPPWS